MEVTYLNKLIKHNNVWYKQLKYLPEHNVTDKGGNVRMDVLAMWRDYVGADHVLRDQMGFMLCETIRDAEVITEQSNQTADEPNV